MRVSDGDSLTVRQTDGSELKIRLCGIDAPERSQPLGREATEHLRSLVAQTDNQVQVVALEKDRYGRTVAEVFTVLGNEEKLLNAEQLMSGNAYLYKEFVNNCPNKLPLETAEAIAQEKRLGVWGGNYQKPWDYRRSKRK
nr:thermonuclease family protein [Trichocoleus sp. FACHB-6]